MKNAMRGNVKIPSGDLQIDIAFGKRWITQKNTQSRLRIKFMRGVRLQNGKLAQPKTFKA